MVLAAVVVIFMLVAAGVFMLSLTLDDQRAQARILRERLSAVKQASTRGSSEELALLRDELLSEIPAINKLLARSRRISNVQRLLSQANMNIRAGKFLVICLGCAFAVGLLALMFTRVHLVGVVFGIFGFLIPFSYASFRRSQRFHRFEELFPEAIELLARAVRAGHAFPTALELIANELGEPVSGEFRILFEEQKFGLPVRDALLNLAERMPLVDVKIFVTAVMLQRETGGNLAEILDKLSYVIRERFKILRQVRIYTAQGRMTMMILMALPPGLVIILMFMNPNFIRVLFTDPIGHVLVAVGIALQIIGFFMIRKIIHIKV